MLAKYNHESQQTSQNLLTIALNLIFIFEISSKVERFKNVFETKQINVTHSHDVFLNIAQAEAFNKLLHKFFGVALGFNPILFPSERFKSYS